MSSRLKIGPRLFDGDQIISALVQYKLLEPLVGQVLLDEVIKDVTLSKQELFQTLVGATDTPVPDDFGEFLTQWCQQKGMTLEYFRAVIMRELQLQKFKQLRFADRVESEFLRVKSDLDQVEYSRIQLADLSMAQEVYFQLRDDGVEFSKLAQQHSLGSDRQTGGWVGPVPVSTLPSEVAALFRSEQTGVVYGPVPVNNCFWVVRLEQFTAARLTEATRTNLMERMYTQWLHAQTRRIIEAPGAIAVQTDATEQTRRQPNRVPVASVA
ncbi:peptidylprolyl isomerase [Leptolyngbya sp. FACHB-36]|uniref:peptidylprolyl isomerase n=1 Tax=Leptolyngbya sp. FACHB-36 TaxID=2692808 RepID=UPI001681A6D9|nr:peptidylprolyl isomerase [Leptolyngbya sp. FACHB-36]MBD2020493.1 peptidylprolyl isomerase [Leptolyngbya sp. FACHB-36]